MKPQRNGHSDISSRFTCHLRNLSDLIEQLADISRDLIYCAGAMNSSIRSFKVNQRSNALLLSFNVPDLVHLFNFGFMSA